MDTPGGELGSERKPSAPPDDGLGPCEWRAVPWRQVSGTGVLVLVLFAALIAYAALWARDPLLVVLSGLAMVYVVGPLLVPTQFRIDIDGVHRASPWTKRSYEWRSFTGYRVDSKGRAVFLRFGGRGFSRFRSSMTLFVPDATTLERVTKRIEQWIPTREG